MTGRETLFDARGLRVGQERPMPRPAPIVLSESGGFIPFSIGDPNRPITIVRMR